MRYVDADRIIERLNNIKMVAVKDSDYIRGMVDGLTKAIAIVETTSIKTESVEAERDELKVRARRLEEDNQILMKAIGKMVLSEVTDNASRD